MACIGNEIGHNCKNLRFLPMIYANTPYTDVARIGALRVGSGRRGNYFNRQFGALLAHPSQ
jgi:hypothetical protein